MGWVGLLVWAMLTRGVGQAWAGGTRKGGLGFEFYIYPFFFFFFFVGLGGLGPLLSSFLIDSILQWYDYDHPKLKLKKLIQSRKRMYFL